jgi:antitoxin FitA
MADVVIDLDDDLIDLLRTKAEINGRSLEEQIRVMLGTAASLTPDEKVALSRRLRARMPLLENFDVRAAIRHGRDDEFC